MKEKTMNCGELIASQYFRLYFEISWQK